MPVSKQALVRLQRRLCREKPRKGILSRKPSVAFRQIADDVRYLRQKGVRFDMDTYIRVDVHADRLNNDRCEVCLAGAVLTAANCTRLNYDGSVLHGLRLDTTPDGATTLKYALNELRMGDPRAFLLRHCWLSLDVTNWLIAKFHEAHLLTLNYVGTMSNRELDSLVADLMALSKKCRELGY